MQATEKMIEVRRVLVIPQPELPLFETVVKQKLVGHFFYLNFHIASQSSAQLLIEKNHISLIFVCFSYMGVCRHPQ